MMGDLVSGRRDRDQLIGKLAQDIKDTLSMTVYEAGEVKRNRESAQLAELRCNIFFLSFIAFGSNNYSVL